MNQETGKEVQKSRAIVFLFYSDASPAAENRRSSQEGGAGGGDSGASGGQSD